MSIICYSKLAPWCETVGAIQQDVDDLLPYQGVDPYLILVQWRSMLCGSGLGWGKSRRLSVASVLGSVISSLLIGSIANHIIHTFRVEKKPLPSQICRGKHVQCNRAGEQNFFRVAFRIFFLGGGRVESRERLTLYVCVYKCMRRCRAYTSK
jgi:hypothetical protein